MTDAVVAFLIGAGCVLPFAVALEETGAECARKVWKWWNEARPPAAGDRAP